ncbi:MAG: sigma 54-interacting transcriptional regulator [Pseudomonadota bacterium]
MKKQRISVIDRDAIRSQAIAQQLAADSTADVIVSGPDGASGAYDDIDAYIVGATGQGHWTASVLDRIKSETPHARVVVVGINGRFERKTLDTETLIVRSAGASADPDTVSSMVKGLLEDQPLPAESPARRPAHLFRSLVGDSQPIRHIQDLIDHVATTPSTVLITGESGTGKEVVARNIHYRSSRRDHPFVPVNCAAIPPELFESELFGHEKGAFTGALSARKGRFELADKGTLFLDEIATCPSARKPNFCASSRSACLNALAVTKACRPTSELLRRRTAISKNGLATSGFDETFTTD